LCFNHVGEQGALHLAQALKTNTTLVKLGYVVLRCRHNSPFSAID
jgi:hypothetical protein